jgi:hypothetical protein
VLYTPAVGSCLKLLAKNFPMQRALIMFRSSILRCVKRLSALSALQARLHAVLRWIITTNRVAIQGA